MFTFIFGFFHAVNVVSFLLSILLLWMYRSLKQNILVQTASAICIVILALLLPAMLVPRLHLQSEVFCWIQACALNYAFVSLHVHFCLLMARNLIRGMGWEVFGIRDVNQLTGLMVIVSLAIPVAPSVILVAGLISPNSSIGRSQRIANSADPWIYTLVDPRGLYCTVSEPAWLSYRLWFIAFSIPGILFACRLLWEIWSARRESLKVKSTTQYTWVQLGRLLLSILIYLFLAGFSIGNLVESRQLVSLREVMRVENMISFCDDCRARGQLSSDDTCRTICPSLRSFLPGLAGLALFFMYGFSSVAVKFRHYLLRKGKVFPATDRASRLDSQSSVYSGTSRASSPTSVGGGRQRTSHQRRTSGLGEEFALIDEMIGSASVGTGMDTAPTTATTTTATVDTSATASTTSTTPTKAQRLQMRRGSEPFKSTERRRQRMQATSSSSIPEEEGEE